MSNAEAVPGGSGSGPALSLELEFPLVLKQQLVTDYDAVVEDGLLVALPRQPCVGDLLQRYITEVG